jgi:DNA-binding winged helix-turn-helix (wHTH) protein
MPDGSDSVLVFGPFRLFPAQRRLEKDGKPLRLGGRALDILTVLAERAGEVVSNRVLLESVWQDVTVEESSLRFHIKNLRKTLGDSQSGTRYVSNVPGRGYCFVAPTTRISARDSSGDQPAARRYALPRFGTRVIGRESVIDALVPQLAERGPLTIVGPGGIGKSTVALALAHARQADYRHGVCFVDLAPLTDPALVLAVVAAALELPLPSGDPSAALIGRFCWFSTVASTSSTLSRFSPTSCWTAHLPSAFWPQAGSHCGRRANMSIASRPWSCRPRRHISRHRRR